MKSSRNIFATGLASIGCMLIMASIIFVAYPSSAYAGRRTPECNECTDGCASDPDTPQLCASPQTGDCTGSDCQGGCGCGQLAAGCGCREV